MKIYATIAIIDLSGDELTTVSLIPVGEVAAFLGEVRAELADLLGVTPTVARAMIDVDVRGSVAVPVPGCFELSAKSRREFAREVAAMLKHRGLQPATSDVSEAA